MTRPMVRYFAWGEHDDSGMTGWQMRGFECLEPVSGFGAAHDALEHFHSAISLDAECLAFGSILFGRGDADQVRAEQLAAEMAGFLADKQETVTSHPVRPLQGEFDWMEDKLLRRFQETLVGSYTDRLIDRGRDFPDDYPVKVAEDVVQMIRRGVHRAARRWGDSNKLVHSFNVVAREVDRLGYPEPGDRMRIRFWPGTYRDPEVIFHERR